MAGKWSTLGKTLIQALFRSDILINSQAIGFRAFTCSTFFDEMLFSPQPEIFRIDL